ncbi:MAG TPA: hypothetical protein DCL69_04000 [Firmicutes bacterium]|nr:hypothetical protein [Bacillota bacterium]
MKDVMVVSDLEAIKTLSDPLRLKILELLIDHQATAKQVSLSVGLSSANVHYHVKELEKQGLIEIVETVEKGGILEKYYRAIANNYFIDHSLGKHKMGSSALDAFNREIMRHRRDEKLQINLERLSDRIANYGLSIKPGEIVLISGGFHQQEMIEHMYAAVVNAGGRPFVTVTSDLMELVNIGALTHDGQAQSDPFYNWLQDIKVLIKFDELVDPSLFASIETEQIDQIARENRVFDMRMDELGVRRLNVSYPTRKKSEVQHIDFELLYDTYWNALNIDYAEIRKIGRKLRERISNAENVTITGPFTNISFKLVNRTPWVDDGVISRNDLAGGQFLTTLPAGQICIAPLEGSANGKVLFHSATYSGQVLSNIMMEFKDGEVISITAEKEETAKYVRDLLFMPVDDDRRKLGVFSMGFNPAIKTPLGSSLIDHKLYGAARLVMGANDRFGGTNISAITWSFLLLGCRVELDGKVLLDQGQFILDDNPS